MLVLDEWHQKGITVDVDVDNEHPLVWILILIGMFEYVEQTFVRYTIDHVLERNASYLSKPLILLVIPVEQFHTMCALWKRNGIPGSLYPFHLFDGATKFILYTLVPAAFVGAVPAQFVRAFDWWALTQMLTTPVRMASSPAKI